MRSTTPIISSSCALGPSELKPICSRLRAAAPMGMGTPCAVPSVIAWFMSFT